MEIRISIKSCQDCPHWSRTRMWTEDSWEEAYDWFCEKANSKKIAGYVEWNDVTKVKIPEWCPCK